MVEATSGAVSTGAKENAEKSEGGGFMDHLREKMKDSSLHDAKIKAIHMKDSLGKFKNIINRNHRHDEEHEQATDAKRTHISDSHRFGSFAPIREGNKVKWYIDGRDYFWAVSEALENAKETIYIEDWWLSPELFLRRPPTSNRKWRLDEILKRRAEAGVQIYVMVYKEVEAALSCNSNHTKRALRALCPEGSPGHGNIHLMRHPDHNVFENAGDMTLYWAHHEKFIVIDYDISFIGGFDLCFGRWDTHQHPLADVSPRGVENTIFPGQDYNNNRILDFHGVDDWRQNQLSKADFGRMPWHDVSMAIIGPATYDIAEHFILRWNFCKRDKYKRDERFDWLCLEGRTGDEEDLVGVQRPKHPVGEYIQHPLSPLDSKKISPNQGTVKAQICRSSADWSSGILTEHSIQNAYKQLISEAQHLVYIENQFFITATGPDQAPVHNTIGESIVDAVIKAHKDGRKFRVIIVMPAIPGFAGDLRSDAAAGTRAIMDYQYKSIHRGENSIMGKISAAGIDASKYVFVFNLRSYDRINKTPAMNEQEERSGVSYQTVQQANAEEIMSSAFNGDGNSSSEDEDGKIRPIHREDIKKNLNKDEIKKKIQKKRRDSSPEDRQEQQMAEQDELIAAKRRFESERENVGLGKFNDVDGDLVADSVDSIAKSALLDELKPSEELWNKDHPDQEKENFIQEQLYPHDKVLIVDDRITICGSANINDRSQLGYHDSELAVVIEDTDMIDSTVAGKPFKVGRHATTLRRQLWREHLGILHAQPNHASEDPNAKPPYDAGNHVDDDNEWYKFVEDPLDDKLWEKWTTQASTNTEVFRHLFHADPDDNVKTFADYDDFLPRKKQKQGHLFDPYIPVNDVRKHLDRIRGHLVWMPLDFLKDETMAEQGLQVNSYTESLYT